MSKIINEDRPPILIPFLILGLTSFGFAPILVKYKPAEASALALATYRTVFSVLLLLPIWLWKEYPKLSFSNVRLWALKASAGSLLGLHFILWISSLSYTSVASASVLVTMHPVLVIVTERFMGRKYPISTWFGVGIAFIGVVVLGVIDSRDSMAIYPDALKGNMLAIGAAMVFVAYFFIGEKARTSGNTTWLGYVFPLYFFAAIICLVTNSIIELQSMFENNFTFLFVAMLLAIGPQILGHGSLNFAVKYIRPTLLSSLILIEPAFSAALAVWLFKELPTVWHVVGMALIMGGIILTWVKKR